MTRSGPGRNRGAPQTLARASDHRTPTPGQLSVLIGSGPFSDFWRHYAWKTGMVDVPSCSCRRAA